MWVRRSWIELANLTWGVKVDATGYLFLGLIVNALLSLVVGYVAGQKGRSQVGFFSLSFLTSFLIGLIVVLAMPSEQQGVPGQSTKDHRVRCAFCAEEILAQAKVCKHCGRDVTPVVVSTDGEPWGDPVWCKWCDGSSLPFNADGSAVTACTTCGKDSKYLAFK